MDGTDDPTPFEQRFLRSTETVEQYRSNLKTVRDSDNRFDINETECRASGTALHSDRSSPQGNTSSSVMTTEYSNTQQTRGYVLPLLVITLANLWALWDTRQQLSEVQAVIIKLHEESSSNRKAIIQVAKAQNQNHGQEAITGLRRRKTP